MLKDRIEGYYLEQDYNCAETMLHAINDEYALEIPTEMFRLISGFGGGMGCGKTCGALCACLAAVGALNITERAHATEGFKDLCAGCVGAFEQALGSTECEVLMQTYKKDDVRCLETVQRAADMFDQFMLK